MTDIKYGSVLKAKSNHPIYKRGGDGVAFVTENANGTDFFTFMWVNGDPATKGFKGDVGAIAHLHTWFDIIPEGLVGQYLPIDFEKPLDPSVDPMAAFLSLLGR